MKLITESSDPTAWRYCLAVLEDYAAGAALHSQCERARCGAALISGVRLLGGGYNGPARDEPRRCARKHELSSTFKSDRTCCVHAEQRAILGALAGGGTCEGTTMYFTRIDKDGQLLPSGEPYCTICSKMALDVGVKEWVLLHADGIRLYTAQEYNDWSFDYGKRSFTDEKDDA